MSGDYEMRYSRIIQHHSSVCFRVFRCRSLTAPRFIQFSKVLTLGTNSWMLKVCCEDSVNSYVREDLPSSLAHSDHSNRLAIVAFVSRLGEKYWREALGKKKGR